MSRRVLTRRAGPRRKLVWARLNGSVLVTSALAPAFASPTRIDVLNEFVAAYGAALIGSTVVRIRGDIHVTGVATQNNFITVAGFIGDANDIVRGPNANDNFYDTNSAGKDYFMVEPFAQTTAAGAALTVGIPQFGRLVDVRAMRKLEEVSQRLIIDVSATAFGAASAVALDFNLSILLMLP